MKSKNLGYAFFIGGFLALLCCSTGYAQTPQFQVQDTWHIGGDGGWDYLKVDPAAHRLYIARGNRVQVVDTNTGKLIHEISGMQGVHGVALDNHGKFGYVSDGRANTVRVFDRATLQVTANIPAGENPDGIVFDPFTQRVFAFNGRSHSATVIDTATDKVLQTIPLPGKPEFPQSDNKGNIYDNIESQNEIVRIDAKKMVVTATWPIAPCDSPSGLAIDRKNHRLFSVCDNNVMAVVDTRNGRVVATPTIGKGPDAARYDAARHLVFSSNGEGGTLTVIQQNSANNYQSIQTLTTQHGARTQALGTSTGKIYLVTASFGPRPAATPQNPRPRPSILPGSFVVLVVGGK
ncbi:MAG TPA: YncE family protein [Acidobacteriaceae bacterium]|nr:YncE family protein [Acidobacteriaceae bacterium]